MGLTISEKSFTRLEICPGVLRPRVLWSTTRQNNLSDSTGYLGDGTSTFSRD